LLDIIAKNVSQKNPLTPVNNGIKRTIIQPTTWYTCPAGKKAVVEGLVQCTNQGAATLMNFIVAGVLYFRWIISGVPVDYRERPFQLDEINQQIAPFRVQLVAGDTIVTTQNAGTNAEFNMYAGFIESEI